MSHWKITRLANELAALLLAFSLVWQGLTLFNHAPGLTQAEANERRRISPRGAEAGPALRARSDEATHDPDHCEICRFLAALSSTIAPRPPSLDTALRPVEIRPPLPSPRLRDQYREKRAPGAEGV